MVVTHETGKGLLVHNNKGRPSNEEKKKRLECPQMIAKEIQKIRSSLRLREDNKLLLLVSIATDDMICLVAMYPEVWFMDCTGGTNNNKMDLFMMAIRTPTGATFPGNLTVIPSGKRWVFMCIYQLAFVQLYGEITCSRNRLALCDEDDSETGPFENCIQSVPCFAKSTLGLCVFHAVWQPFKAEVFKFLPKQTNGLLTSIGKTWGMLYFVALVL